METTVCNKVPLIKSIAHSWFDLTGKRIDSNEFDFLYDQCVEDLTTYAEQLKMRLAMNSLIADLFKR
jgi:hypothetical protein